MEKYALSQILLELQYIRNITSQLISSAREKQQIIILKARGSMTHKSEAMILEQMLKEKDRGVVIIQESQQNNILKKLESIKSIEIIEQRPLIELRSEEIHKNESLLQHQFISKDSGGHVAKPGTKEYRAFKNNFNKNSYKKKKRK